jgi:putative transposase
MRRKYQLETGETYHIFSRSIAEFKILNENSDFCRMIDSFVFFQVEEPPTSFSIYKRLEKVQKEGFEKCFASISKDQINTIQIIAYCLMPTHIHLILKQLSPFGISKFMSDVLNSYTRYFNVKHKRKGPLWESKFQNVLIESDEQLLHLTRYIHLNPTTASLVKKPEDWRYSSYKEYLNQTKHHICKFDDLLTIHPKKYITFIQDRIAYQRELGIIKKQLIDGS